MSDDAPILGLTGQEQYQYAQVINLLAPAILRRLRAHRESTGRLAYDDAEQAALQHEARQHPPIRLMSDDEQAEWQRRVPASLAAQQPGEPVSVWSARLVDPQGNLIDEWGVEARSWDERGRPTAALFAVCRDAEDALAMSRHLREHGAPGHLAELHDLAARAPGQFVRSPLPTAGRGEALGAGPAFGRRGGVAAPLVLSEQEWASALRRALPERVADGVVVTDPGHPHHAAWQELHELANEEVVRVGADPDRLAALVRAVPQWREDVRNPPALAHWAITQSRTHPKYERMVTTQPASAVELGQSNQQPAVPDPRSAATPAESQAARLRLTDVRTPNQALVWAQSLDAANAQHRIEAKTGFGRWGGQVDATLAAKFPGLTASTKAAAKKSRGGERSGEQDAAAVLTGEQDGVEVGRATRAETTAVPETQPAVLRGYAEDIARLDPGKAIDRRAAHIMLGRIDPEIDRLIAAKFGDDTKITERVQALYPDGLPEADAAAWRNRADADEAVAAAQRGTPDDPLTPQREDADATVAAQPAQEAAAQERGIAAAVAGTQSPVVRRVIQTTTNPTTGPVRRG